MRQFILFCCLGSISLGCFAEPENLNTVKKRLINYHDSGAYEQEISLVTHNAKKYIKSVIKANNRLAQPKKLAVVFDIDETVLSNYADMAALSFGGTLDTIQARIGQGRATAIAPTTQLYHFLQKNHITVFFVTGRPEHQRQVTATNLHKVGLIGYQHLYCKPAHIHPRSAAEFKIKARKNIEEQGYSIIASIGDQRSDLQGGHAARVFKLPNPYYYIP